MSETPEDALRVAIHDLLVAMPGENTTHRWRAVERHVAALKRAAAEAALRWAWEHPAYGLKWEVGAGTEQDWEGLLAEFVARGAEGVGDAR